MIRLLAEALLILFKMEQLNLFNRAYRNEKYGVVYATSDYEMFKYVTGNRGINERSVERLASDIRVKGQINAVMITPECYVIDGQHRILACKKLHIPVKFVITPVDGLSDLDYIMSANTVNHNWGWRNYLEMYCVLGKESYISYKKLMDRFKFDHTAMLSAVLFTRGDGGAGGPNDFNKGNLRIRNINDVINRLENIEEYWRLISRAYANMPGKHKSSPPAKLVRALVKIIKHHMFDHDIMLMKLKNDVSGFVGINSLKGFVSELTKIYNLRNRTNIIKFD